MSKTGIINVAKRVKTNSRSSKRLREAGFLPGNVYGNGVVSIPVMVKKEELRKNLSEYGRNAIFKLALDDGEVFNIIVKEVQYAPVGRKPLHVNFQNVSFDEKIKADVAIRLVGTDHLEAKRMLVLQHVDFLPVSGLPQDIPDQLGLDVSEIDFGDNIFIKDLKLPDNICALIDMNELVASASS